MDLPIIHVVVNMKCVLSRAGCNIIVQRMRWCDRPRFQGTMFHCKFVGPTALLRDLGICEFAPPYSFLPPYRKLSEDLVFLRSCQILRKTVIP